MITGNIPDSVTYHIVLCGDKNPAFPRDSSNKKTEETAIRWASGKSHRWDHQSQTKKTYTTDIQTYPNTPTGGYKIVDLERRDEGGRAYKVITPQGYYVDLREDTLMDVIKNCGILAGGILNAELLWATIGSQFKLIRNGSDTHKEILQNMDMKSSKPISASDLEIGGIYVNSSNKQFVYLGIMNGFIYKRSEKRVSYLDQNMDKVYQKNHQCWYEVAYYAPEVNIATIVDHYFYIELVKNKKVVKKIGKENIDINELLNELIKSKNRDNFIGWEPVK